MVYFLYQENFENINSSNITDVDVHYIKTLDIVTKLEEKSEIITELDRKYNREDIIQDVIIFIEKYPDIDILKTTSKIVIITKPTDTRDGHYEFFPDPDYPIDNKITDTSIKYCNYKIDSKVYYIEDKNDIEILENKNKYFVYVVAMLSITVLSFTFFIIHTLIRGFNLVSLLIFILILLLFILTIVITYYYLKLRRQEKDIIKAADINCEEKLGTIL